MMMILAALLASAFQDVEARLAEGKPDEAAAALDKMLQEHPDAPETVRACRLVFKAIDPAKGTAYARRWLDLAKEPTPAELQEAADYLYRGACARNGFSETTASFAEDRTLKDRLSWEAAARAHRLLVECGKQDARERLARCLSFLARDEQEWEQARAQYDAIIKSKKALKPNGTLDPAVIQAEPSLLQVYFELGEAHVEIAKRGPKVVQFDNAMTVYSNVLRLVPSDTALWWQCKYRILECSFERGMTADVRPGNPLGEQRQPPSPAYDGGKFGMKPKFEALMEKIRKGKPDR